MLTLPSYIQCTRGGMQDISSALQRAASEGLDWGWGRDTYSAMALANSTMPESLLKAGATTVVEPSMWAAQHAITAAALPWAPLPANLKGTRRPKYLADKAARSTLRTLVDTLPEVAPPLVRLVP